MADLWRRFLEIFFDREILAYAIGFCLFEGFMRRTKGDARSANASLSILHHVVAVLVGVYCMYVDSDKIFSGSVCRLSNDRFPFAVWLNQFNIAYMLADFPYCLQHARVFIPHHLVVLVACGGVVAFQTSALGNAVNFVFAEIGGLLYQAYVHNKSRRNFTMFLVAYAFSRLLLLIWSGEVFRQIIACYGASGEDPWWHPGWIGALQIPLILLNADFLLKQIKKYLRDDSVSCSGEQEVLLDGGGSGAGWRMKQGAERVAPRRGSVEGRGGG